jgi:hypothetical protein
MEYKNGLEVLEIFAVGAEFKIWMKLLSENRFNISLKKLPQLFAITFMTFIFSPFNLAESIIAWRRIKRYKLKEQPIFILGHWRNGTTFLHELLVSDPRYEYMTLTESVFPNLFLFFYSIIRRIFGFFLPETRPQDNLKINSELPSEHDFAMANLNSMSPYSGAYFPKKQDHYNRYLTLQDVSEEDIETMKKDMDYLIKKLSIRKRNKRLVMKSPLDTARVDVLLDLYPNAKFVHISRDPYKVFFSTRRMFQTLIPIMQLQNNYPDLDEFVFSNYERIYAKYYSDVGLIPEENFVEIKYEDLKQEPLKTMKTIYDELGLGEFEEAIPNIQKHLDKNKNFKVSSYNITAQEKSKIYTRWKEVIDKMGY